MSNKKTKLIEMGGYDDLKIQAIDRFRSQDPTTLSNSELRSAIDYMLAYRWALDGDEDVLNEYIEAFKMRSINSTKNESRYMVKKLIRLTEEDLHRIVKESVEKVLRESEPDLYDTLARPNGELDMSNPYTWAKSPKMLKDMGYDENGMKNGKKYYDHLLNPNWRFNKRSAGTDFALNEPMGDQKSIRADIANIAKKQSDADARWQKAADSRPLHRKGSPNRDI